MNLESTEQRNIRGAIGLLCSIFHVNTGRAYISNRGPAGVSRLADSSVLVKAAQPVAIGYADPKGQPVSGVADLNGWTSVETKRTKGGRISPAQQAGLIFSVKGTRPARDSMRPL